MPTVGDTQVLRLQLTPAGDLTTSASVAVRDPDGTVVTVTSPSTADGGTTWTAGPLTYTKAGIWRIAWTVTGTGAGAETQKVAVGPSESSWTGRSYATSGDLADYLQDTPPDSADRMLARATEIIDRILMTARYATDADGEPTDADVIAALKKATCAQAAWWINTGDETGIAGQYQSVSIGSVSLTRGYSSKGSAAGESARISPDVWAALAEGGLTGHAAEVWGWW